MRCLSGPALVLLAVTLASCGDHYQDVLDEGERPSFFVEGRHLYDRCGERVVLRGVNEMVVWGDTRGERTFPEVERTGANAVRLSWNETGTATNLDAALANARSSQLIPMPEFHLYAADAAGVQTIVDYWTRPDIVAVLQKHRKNLLLNLSAGMGTSAISDDDWVTIQSSAIARLRAAGIHVPIAISPPSWGQKAETLLAKGPTLIEQDPDHDVLLGIQAWWLPASGYSDQTVRDVFQAAVDADLPIFVAEFAPIGPGPDCLPGVPYQAIIERGEAHQMGWLAWSWGTAANTSCNGGLDMTVGGSFATLHGWGLEVATSSPYSIANTSVRPRSLTTGRCD